MDLIRFINNRYESLICCLIAFGIASIGLNLPYIKFLYYLPIISCIILFCWSFFHNRKLMSLFSLNKIHVHFLLLFNFLGIGLLILTNYQEADLDIAIIRFHIIPIVLIFIGLNLSNSSFIKRDKIQIFIGLLCLLFSCYFIATGIYTMDATSNELAAGLKGRFHRGYINFNINTFETATWLGMAAFPACYILCGFMSFRNKIINFSSLLLLIYLIIKLETRSLMVVVILCLVCSTFVSSTKKISPKTVILISLGFVCIGIIAYVGQTYSERYTIIYTSENLIYGRLTMWMDKFNFLSIYPNGLKQLNLMNITSHNLFIDIWFVYGFIPFLLMVVGFLFPFIMLVKRRGVWNNYSICEQKNLIVIGIAFLYFLVESPIFSSKTLYYITCYNLSLHTIKT